jgi:hypothetical protein
MRGIRQGAETDMDNSLANRQHYDDPSPEGSRRRPVGRTGDGGPAGQIARARSDVNPATRRGYIAW